MWLEFPVCGRLRYGRHIVAMKYRAGNPGTMLFTARAVTAWSKSSAWCMTECR
jgi:hypothetical protein